MTSFTMIIKKIHDTDFYTIENGETVEHHGTVVFATDKNSDLICYGEKCPHEQAYHPAFDEIADCWYSSVNKPKKDKMFDLFLENGVRYKKRRLP